MDNPADEAAANGKPNHATLLIQFDPDTGASNVIGPLKDRPLCWAMIGAAIERMAVRAVLDEAKKIQVAQPGDLPPGIRL